MALIAALWLLPSFSMLVISFRQAGLFEQSGWWNVFVHISQLTLTNYKQLFSGGVGSTVPSGMAAGGALDSVRTSLEITVPATLLVVIVSAMAAYSLVFGRWKGRNTVFLTCVGLMVVPLQVAILPVVQGFHSLGNLTGWNPYGTIEGVVIFHVAFGLPFGIFLMRNFYLGIPKDLIEAGRVDGAGEFTLFRRVVVPIGVAAAASLAIFQFIWTWNDLLVALVILGADPHVPITLFIYGQERTLAAGLDHHPAGRLPGFPALLRARHARRRSEVGHRRPQHEPGSLFVFFEVPLRGQEKACCPSRCSWHQPGGCCGGPGGSRVASGHK